MTTTQSDSRSAIQRQALHRVCGFVMALALSTVVHAFQQDGPVSDKPASTEGVAGESTRILLDQQSDDKIITVPVGVTQYRWERRMAGQAESIRATSGCTNCHQTNPNLQRSNEAAYRLHLDLTGLPPSATNKVAIESLAPVAGIELSLPDSLTRTLLRLPEDFGVVVEKICPYFERQLGMLAPNDIILEADGQAVNDPLFFNDLLQHRGRDKPVELHVRRAGAPLTLTIPPLSGLEESASKSDDNRPVIGVEIGDAAPVIRAQLQLPENANVVIQRVVERSPAEKAGLQVGDFVLKVNETVISEIADLQQAIADSAGQTLKLLILRDRESITLEVEPLPRQDLFPTVGAATGTPRNRGARQLEDLTQQYNLYVTPSWQAYDVLAQEPPANVNSIRVTVEDLNEILSARQAQGQPTASVVEGAGSQPGDLAKELRQVQRQLDSLTAAVNRLTQALESQKDSSQDPE